MIFLETLFKLLIAHAFSDFALQPEAMAKGKNRNRKIDPKLIPEGQRPVKVWLYYLLAHALISAGCILIFVPYLPMYYIPLEFFLHFVIDFIKCENKTNPHEDQLLHFLTKIMYSITYSIIL